MKTFVKYLIYLKIIIYCNSNSIITSTVDIKNSWLLITIDILQIILFNYYYK